MAEGFFLYIFFILFQPFDISEWSDPNKYIKLAGFAVITSLSTFAHRQIFPKFFPNFHHEKNWVIWKEIVGVLILLMIICIGNMAYGKFLFNWSMGFSSWLVIFTYVVTIAFFPTVFWILSDYIYQLKKFSKPIEIHPIHDFKGNETLNLSSENEKDVLSIKNKDLLYIESSENYSTIFFLQNERVEKILLRSSLSRLETQISDTNIVRVHRSYVANLENVIKLSGNAQGYKLHFQQTTFLVPVARKFSFLIDRFR